MIDYIANRHGVIDQEKLTALGLMPPHITEYEISAAIKMANAGPGVWTRVV